MRNIVLLSICTAVFILMSCKSKSKLKSISKEAVRYELTKGVCFGKCPVFTLTISEGGLATYEGKNFTDKMGIHQRQLSIDEKKTLDAAFVNIPFNTYPDVFDSKYSDLPNIVIGFNDGSGFRKVSGKEDRPQELMEGQFQLEKIVDSGSWDIVESYESINLKNGPQASFIKDEFIIELEKGVSIKKWLDYRSDLGTRLLKVIAPGLDYYLITYDKSKISSMEMLKTLQSDPQIKKAEYNKKTSQRGGR